MICADRHLIMCFDSGMHFETADYGCCSLGWLSHGGWDYCHRNRQANFRVLRGRCPTCCQSISKLTSDNLNFARRLQALQAWLSSLRIALSSGYQSRLLRTVSALSLTLLQSSVNTFFCSNAPTSRLFCLKACDGVIPFAANASLTHAIWNS